MASFAKKTFDMYGGVDAEVPLECKNAKAFLNNTPVIFSNRIVITE